MLKTYSRKALSLIFTIAIAAILIAGLTNTASAAWDGSSIDTTWYSPSGTSFTLADEADLAGLAGIVNGTVLNNPSYLDSSGNQITAADSFNGDSITLSSGGSFNLNNNAWTPIGGRWAGSNGYPPDGTKYFAGVFNGNDQTISGLNITNPTYSGVGLFGYCNRGVIANLTVSGAISVSGSYAAIGGIVGYTNSSVFNCTNNVDVTAASSSNVGGVAGVVENKDTTLTNPKVLVQYCTNNGDVSGRSRIGGVVGATYVIAASEGMINVDRCTNNGYVWTASDAYKTFIGGIVGYCQGDISNCINSHTNPGTTIGKIEATSGDDGHRMGGVVGILNGYSSIYANMANCVNLGTIVNGYPDATYDGALCYDEGGSTTMTNSFWEDTCIIDQIVRGTGTNVLELTQAQLQKDAYVSGSNHIDYYLNDDVPWNWSGIAGDAYTCTPSSYPYITAVSSSNPYYTNPGSLPKGVTSAIAGNDNAFTGGVYYDPSAGTNGTGTFSSPYNDFSDAVDDGGTNNTVILKGPVTSAALSGVTIPSGMTFARSYVYRGYLFEISANWNASSLTFVIDGNATCADNRSLIRVTGGTVTLGSGVTLRNNDASNNGAAISMLGGTVTLDGTITANSTFANGGGVAVMSDPEASTYGTFYLNGTIGGAAAGAGNSAENNGGGIYVGEDGEAYIGATAVIRYNAAGINGGPGYVKDTGTLVITPTPTISNNTPNDNFYYE